MWGGNFDKFGHPIRREQQQQLESKNMSGAGTQPSEEAGTEAVPNLQGQQKTAGEASSNATESHIVQPQLKECQTSQVHQASCTTMQSIPSDEQFMERTASTVATAPAPVEMQSIQCPDVLDQVQPLSQEIAAHSSANIVAVSDQEANDIQQNMDTAGSAATAIDAVDFKDVKAKWESFACVKVTADSFQDSLMALQSLHMKSDPSTRCAHFVVIPSPSLKIGKSETLAIVFGHPTMGVWNEPHPMVPIINLDKEYTLYAGNVSIPRDLLKTEYKYVVIKRKSMQIKESEEFHLKSVGNPYRSLRIPETQNGDWYQIDLLCYSQKLDERSLLQHVTDKVVSLVGSKPSFSLSDILTENHWRAWEWLRPKLNFQEGAFRFPFDLNNFRNSGGDAVLLTTAQTVATLSSILYSLSKIFDDGNGILERSTALKWIEEWLNRLLDKTKDQSEWRLTVAMIILNCAYSQSSWLKLDKQILIKLCNLFSKMPQDTEDGVWQLVSSDWFVEAKRVTNDLANPWAMFAWLVKSVNYHPSIIPVLSVCHFMEPARSSVTDFQDVGYWLPQPLALKSIDFPAWNGQLTEVKKYLDKSNVCTELIGAILRLHCRFPVDASQLLQDFPEQAVEKVIAWCALYFRYLATYDYRHPNYIHDISALFGHLMALISTSNTTLNQDWLDVERKSMVCESLVGILKELDRSDHHKIADRSFIISLVNLISTIETRLESVCPQAAVRMMENMSIFLTSKQFVCLAPKGDWNHDQIKQTIKQYFSLRPTGKQTNKIWLSWCKSMLETWAKTSICAEAILGLCASDDLDAMEQPLQDSINNAASSIAIDYIQVADKLQTAIEWLNRYITKEKAYRLIFSLVIQHYWKPEIATLASMVVLEHFVKWPFADLYLDQSLIKRELLDDLAAGKIFIAEEKIRKALKTFHNGDINIEMITFLKDHADRFYQLCNFLHIDLFNKFQNFQSIVSAFHILISQLATLKIYITTSKKFHDYNAYFTLLDRPENEYKIVDICQIDPSGMFGLKFRMADSLVEMSARLESLHDNKLFKIIWQESVHAVRTPISIQETPRAIMAVAEDAARQFLISLRDLTLTFGETERFLNLDCPDKESVVKHLSEKVLKSSEWVSESLRRIQVYQHMKRSNIVHNDVEALIDQLQLAKCSMELAQFHVVQDNHGRLKDVNENMLKNIEDINSFSETYRSLFLRQILDVAPLLEWLRSRFSDDTDFQNVITIARQAVGDKERELAFLEQASRLVSDCQRLFFNLNTETGLDEFLESLKSVFRTGFGTTQSDVSQMLDFLKSLDEKLLDLEKASIAEASVINKSGILRVEYEETDDGNKDVDRWIKVELSDDTNTKYSPSELRDLNSRLTLIGDHGGGTMEARREMDAFVKLHKGLERLAVACQRHRQSGNVFLSNWTCSFYSDCATRTIYGTAHFGSGHIESVLVTAKPPILEELQTLCQILEAALGEWHKHLRQVRHKYPILSQYTNSQMEILRRRLAGWNT